MYDICTRIHMFNCFFTYLQYTALYHLDNDEPTSNCNETGNKIQQFIWKCNAKQMKTIEYCTSIMAHTWNMQRDVPRTGNPQPNSLNPGLASPIIWKPSIPGPSSEVRVDFLLSQYTRRIRYATHSQEIRHITFWTKGSWHEPISFWHAVHHVAFGISVLYIWPREQMQRYLEMGI